MIDMTDDLNDLCHALGIWTSFTDYDSGKEYQASTEVKQQLCHALGFPAATEKELKQSMIKVEQERFLDFVPYTKVVKEDELTPLTLSFSILRSKVGRDITWILTREDGTSQTGVIHFDEQVSFIEEKEIRRVCYQRYQAQIQISASLGYHTLSFLPEDGQTAGRNYQMHLIIVPHQCYRPPCLENGERLWGFPLQLYAVRSYRNWGMGDLTDLKNFADIAAHTQSALIGINPLNALFPDSPQDASPYCASSRLFLNPLYIDTDATPESHGVTYLAYKKSQRFQELLSAARESDQVVYEYVAEMKYQALNCLFDTFLELHLDENYQAKTARGEQFLAFCQEQGAELSSFATYQVLRSYFKKKGKVPLWWRWGKKFQTPGTPAIQTFQKEYASSLWFIKYQQFLLAEQFAAAAKAYYRPDIPLGLYTDLPVGVGENSAEVWSHQDLFLPHLTIGTPPDLFTQKGQDWSLAAYNPRVLQKTGYAFFIKVLRSVMAYAGVVRIDHAFSFERLYLNVPQKGGAYLSYPVDEIMGIVALESVRQKTVVVAEDLGTAPAGFRDRLAAYGMLSFRLFLYQRQGDELLPPALYEPMCVVSPGSHDSPTYPAYWKGLDLLLSYQRGLLQQGDYEQSLIERSQECLRFMRAFEREGLMEGIAPETFDSIANNRQLIPDWFIPNVYAFLGRCRSILMLVRLEDLLGQEEQVNVPGTYLEYPNWRYKLPLPVEELERASGMIQALVKIQENRCQHKE